LLLQAAEHILHEISARVTTTAAAAAAARR
jgi:hypothetical protein